jgi:hypothetical protein
MFLLLEEIKRKINQPSKGFFIAKCDSLAGDLQKSQIENAQAQKKIEAAYTLFALAGRDINDLVDEAKIKAEKLSGELMQKREKGNTLLREANLLEEEASQLKMAALMMATPKQG